MRPLLRRERPRVQIRPLAVDRHTRLLALRGHLGRDCLSAVQHPQDVSAREEGEVVVCPTPPDELGELQDQL